MLLRLILFFLLFTSFSSFAQDLAEQETHTFHWGTLTDTLTQNDSYNNSVVIVSDFSTLKSLIDDPLFVRKNGKRIELESFGLYIYNYRRKDLSKMFKVDKYQSRKASKFHGREKIGHLLTEDSNLSLVNAKTKDGFTFQINIQFEKKNNGYIPPFKLPNIPKGEVFKFQVVSFENQKTILRVDTTNQDIQHIIKIYSNPEKYQIIHIPNFKTTRRYISEDDLLDVKTKSVNVIENEPLANLSFINVQEFTDYSIENIPFILQWGDLKNINYEKVNVMEFIGEENQFIPEDIIENQNRPLFLNQGFQDFEILKMRVSILPESGIPISFITDHLNYPKIQNSLEKIGSSTTIVFDEIFIKNKDGQTIFLPPAFRFIVE